MFAFGVEKVFAHFLIEASQRIIDLDVELVQYLDQVFFLICN